MTKYSLVLVNSELEPFLDKLRDFGMIDITRSTRAMDEHSKALMAISNKYKKLIRDIKNVAKVKSEKKALKFEIENEENILDVINNILTERKTLTDLLAQRKRDLSDAISWGDFNKSDITKLEELGYRLYFYVTAAKKFDTNWENENILQILSAKDNPRTYFVILSKDQDFKFSLQEAKLPERSVSELTAEIKDLTNRLDFLERKVIYIPEFLPRITELYDSTNNDLDYYFAKISTVTSGEDSIAVLESFAPTSEDEKILEFLENSDVYFIKDAAKIEDNPPIKLKNNIFTKPFEAIGDLYMLPKYNEPDLTPYFAPFYMLFFGFCLGDMGYGLVLLLIGLFMMWKLPKMKEYGKLVMYLGIGTIIIPALSGGFFGTKIYELFSFPDRISKLFLSDMQLFWFGILFGIVHIIFGRLINIIDCLKKRNWDHALTNIGWIMLIIVFTFMYAGSMAEKQYFPDLVNKILIWGGIALIICCSKPDKKFWMRPIKGIASLYDITGIFGDVLSYIRLFGLGTSGAILGLVVDSVAIQMSGIPYLGWFLAVLMLIIGHTFVLAISSLGAFVHPMRLTFVEFYKNAEFAGGGRAFHPFRKKVTVSE
ncbi:MAG: V-type ATPase 116kDa subunit family protein [Bacteroidales bacterium]